MTTEEREPCDMCDGVGHLDIMGMRDHYQDFPCPLCNLSELVKTDSSAIERAVEAERQRCIEAVEAVNESAAGTGWAEATEAICAKCEAAIRARVGDGK